MSKVNRVVVTTIKENKKGEKMGKKFGLKEAQILAYEPDAHLPTVKATLKILGVPNVVGKQVANLVARAKAVVAQANAAVAGIRVMDVADEKATMNAMDNLRGERNSRTRANAAAITDHGNVVTNRQAEIARLEELAKKFA